MRSTQDDRIRDVGWLVSLVIMGVIGCSQKSGPSPEPYVALDCIANPGLVHPLFTDGMVLQRDVSIPIWGCAAPGSEVDVAIAGQSQNAKANEAGIWTLRLDSMSEGGPYELVITNGESRTIRDVLVGDVWLCSGQSNMAMSVSGVLNNEQEIADAINYGSIRMLTVPTKNSPRPAETFARAASWRKASPETVGGFSATCYFFARELYKSVHVPMGLIQSSVGGTSIEWWMSAGALESDPDFSQDVADVAAGAFPADKPYVTSLYNGMIAPLLPLALRGMVWYQGENNAGASLQYQRLLPNMIQDWRDHFDSSDVPFLVVQLPRYQSSQTSPSEGGWAGLREAQLLASLTTRKVGLAVTIDTGEPDNIHPKDKQDVGARLAILARGLVYGETIAYQSPTYKSMALENGKIRISFDNPGTGLMIGSKQPLQPVQEVSDGTLEGFAIAGNDKKFVWATATIEDSTVVVSAPGVTAPVSVRYGWASNPPCNLYGRNGLPVSPFRTDGW